MIRKAMTLAVGSALAASAGAAFALTPGNFNPATISQVRMSGATAQDGGVVAYMQRACTPGTLDSYTATATAVTVFICNHAVLNKPIAVQKESNGGSSRGIGPVRDQTNLTFVDISTINATNCNTTATGFGPVAATPPIAPDVLGLPAYTRWQCPGVSTVSAFPHIGYSDVDPGIFGESSAGLTVDSPNQLLFGVPVTKTLRDALQTAQGLVAGSETSANMPSLSTEQVAGIYSQFIATADLLGIGNANDIYVARRGDTSGSQKTAEIHILNQNVNPGDSPMAFPAPTVGPKAFVAGDCNGLNPGELFAGNGTGDVRSCLNELNTHGKYGVGISSMESRMVTSGGSPTGWRWIKLNGVMPTVSNAIKGLYQYWSEQAITKKSTLAGDGAALYADIAAKLGDPGILAILNKSFNVFDNALMGGAGETAGSQATGLMLPPTIAGVTSCPAKFSGASTADTDPRNISSRAVNGFVDNRIKPAVVQCAPR